MRLIDADALETTLERREQDNSIKAEYAKDMADIPCVDIEVDEDTGEVIDAPADGQATMEGM